MSTVRAIWSTPDIAVLCMACLGVGYYLGVATASARVPVQQEQKVVVDSKDDSEEDEELYDGDIAAVEGIGPCKLVFVVRRDLNMSPGKIAAQCGWDVLKISSIDPIHLENDRHASLACYKALSRKNPKLVRHWETTGQAKIALRADSEDQLLELEAIAKSLNLCARSIHDAGHTQVEAGSKTVLGIGPGPVELVNEVTGNLRLL